MRLPRTLRLDASDLETFDVVAEPGEWAVSGAFAFSDREPSLLMGAEHRAFRSGFLGTRSFGWSSLVGVQEIGEAEYRRTVEALAQHLLERYHAPDQATARAFAEEECKFAQSLCERPVGTVIAVEREFGPQGIVERFRTVERPR
ncbi:MAG TPA: DUF6505 family protein [Stellaceae bacterium]|nr:DUF6505 family protein [Stellaceae bacterium]